jgi:hypothetical protein
VITIQEATTFRAREVVAKSEFANDPKAVNLLRDCLIRSSVRHMGMVDGKIACMWGLVPQTILSNQAYLWLITTDIAIEHKFLLVRYSQLFVEKALEHYPVITGHCAAGDFKAKRWLRWLGAEFGDSDGKQITFKIERKE